MQMRSATYSNDRSQRLNRGQVRSRAVTMIETALATIIVGLSVMAIVKLITAVTQQNWYAQKTTTAMALANDMREYMNGLPMSRSAAGIHLGVLSGTAQSSFLDVEDFAGFTNTPYATTSAGFPTGYVAWPPIDAYGQPIISLSNWQQKVSVIHVLPGTFNQTDPTANNPNVVLDRVTITVSYNVPGTNTWTQIASIQWLKAKL